MTNTPNILFFQCKRQSWAFKYYWYCISLEKIGATLCLVQLPKNMIWLN